MSASTFCSRLAQVCGSLSRYSSSGSRGVAWTSRYRLPPSVNALGDRQLQEVAPLLGPERFPHRRPGNLRQVAETVLAADRDPLRHSVVVVAADRISGMGHRPADARRGVGPVVDQVAQAEADVERLGDRREGGPVRMDVGDDQNPHVA